MAKQKENAVGQGAAGAQPAPTELETKIDDARLRNLLEIGRVAKVKQYQALLAKIRDGEALSSAEQRSFQVLEREFAGALLGFGRIPV